MWKTIKTRLLQKSKLMLWKFFKTARSVNQFQLTRLPDLNYKKRPRLFFKSTPGKGKGPWAIFKTDLGRFLFEAGLKPQIRNLTNEQKLAFAIKRYYFWYLSYLVSLPLNQVEWLDLLERGVNLFRTHMRILFPWIWVNLIIPLSYASLKWQMGAHLWRKKRRADLLFFGQLFSLSRQQKLRPQQSYKKYGGTDVWGVWLTHLKINRLVYTLLRNMEAGTRERFFRYSFSFKSKLSRDTGPQSALRVAIFRHAFFKYLQPRKFNPIEAAGKPRASRLTHYFNRRDFVVRRYTELQARKARGGHPLWLPKSRLSLRSISAIERQDFKPTSRLILTSYFFALRSIRGFDHTVKWNFKKHSDLNRLSWRFRTRRFRVQKLRYSSTTRIMYKNIGYFPLNLWRHWWEFKWEHPFFWKRSHAFWWAYGAKFREKDFPWKGAVLRPLLHSYLVDKATDWASRNKFLRYYDEAHYSYGPGAHFLRTSFGGFVTHGIKLWRLEMMGIWNRRKPAQPYKHRANFKLYLVSRWWRDRVWATPLLLFYNHLLNGPRWIAKRKLHRYYNRNRRVFMSFYHLSFLWFGASPTRRKYLGIEKGRSGGTSVKHRQVSCFFKNKYLSFGRFLVWGRDFIDDWYADERLKFIREYSYTDALISKPRVLRRFIFARPSELNFIALANRFSWVRSGAYYTDRRVFNWTRREAPVARNLKLMFYYTWRRKSYNTRDRRAFEKFSRLFLRNKLMRTTTFVPLWTFQYVKTFFALHESKISDSPRWWLQNRQKIAYKSPWGKRIFIRQQKVTYYYAWWYASVQVWELEGWHNMIRFWYHRGPFRGLNPYVEEDFITINPFAHEAVAFVFLAFWRKRFQDRFQVRNYCDRDYDFDLNMSIFTSQLEAGNSYVNKFRPWMVVRQQEGWGSGRRKLWQKERFTYYRLHHQPNVRRNLPSHYTPVPWLQDAGRSDGVTGFTQRGFLWHRMIWTDYLLSVVRYFVDEEERWPRPDVRKWNIGKVRFLKNTPYNLRSGLKKL